MNLFDIDAGIRAFLDGLYAQVDEDGVIEADLDQLEALQAERDTKWENIALYIKELDVEAEALKAEKIKLGERQKVTENKAKRLREYLAGSMQRNQTPKFETAKCKLSFRRSERVIIPDEDKLDEHYLLKNIVYKANTDEIKKALKRGEAVEGAYLEECQNLQVK